MQFNIWNVLQILGALCFFIFGMKMMSDGIQRAAGAQLRRILGLMTKNRIFGVVTGFLTTALVQSSSATTVMTVSFVNAGLLTLVESAGIMMGANVGTTITGWLVSVLGFKVNLSTYSIPLLAFGVPLVFYNKGKFKYWGEFIIGFSILFLGLSYLRVYVPDLKNQPDVLNFLAGFTGFGVWSRILFVFIGALVTIIVQSSSAAMAITLTMCAQGWLPFEIAASMILGENIGTTITAEVASLVGNRDARRSARIHSMFNIFGVIWMVLVLPYFLPLVSNISQSILGIGDPYINATEMPVALSAFHTAFNITNLLIMIWFAHGLVKMAKWMIPDRSNDKERSKLKFINTTSRTPELATVELKKEIVHFGEIVTRMSIFTSELLNTTNVEKQAEYYQRFKKYERITDNIKKEVTEYIQKLTNAQITPQTNSNLQRMQFICNQLEVIGDLFYKLGKTIEKKNKNRSYFLPSQRNNINEILVLVKSAFDEMNRNLTFLGSSEIDLSQSKEIEKQINAMRSRMREENLHRLGTEGYKKDSAMVYNSLFNGLENIGNHIFSINKAINGEH